jgi:RNA polymerase sigma factor (sigma-70 family)
MPLSNQNYVRWTNDEHVTDEALLEQFRALIWAVARRMQRSYKLSDSDAEDIASGIQLGLLRLPQAKRPYTGYCRMVINNAARNALGSIVGRGSTPKNDWRVSHTMSYAAASPTGDGDDDGTAIERLTSTGSPEDALVQRVTLVNAIATLTEREQTVVRLFYGLDGDECSTQIIADRLGVTHQVVYNTLKIALRKLKSKLTN